MVEPLKDQIANKLKRQHSMIERFNKRDTRSVDFATVDVKPTKGASVEREKGLIVPKINYVEDNDD